MNLAAIGENIKRHSWCGDVFVHRLNNFEIPFKSSSQPWCWGVYFLYFGLVVMDLIFLVCHNNVKAQNFVCNDELPELPPFEAITRISVVAPRGRSTHLTDQRANRCLWSKPPLSNHCERLRKPEVFPTQPAVADYIGKQDETLIKLINA